MTDPVGECRLQFITTKPASGKLRELIPMRAWLCLHQTHSDNVRPSIRCLNNVPDFRVADASATA